jgi:hypothetical protein
MERDLLPHREANTCRLCEMTRCAEKPAHFVQSASKIKLSLDAMSACGRNSGVVPLILNFSTRWK